MLGRRHNEIIEWQGLTVGAAMLIFDATANDIEGIVEILSDRIDLGRQVNFSPRIYGHNLIVAEI